MKFLIVQIDFSQLRVWKTQQPDIFSCQAASSPLVHPLFNHESNEVLIAIEQIDTAKPTLAQTALPLICPAKFIIISASRCYAYYPVKQPDFQLLIAGLLQTIFSRSLNGIKSN